MKNLKIGIVGLGLIGGSFAKAIRTNTGHLIYGADIDTHAIQSAKRDGVLDGMLETAIDVCDIVIIAINPKACENYLSEKASNFKKGALVLDCCGVKRDICDLGGKLSKEYGFVFIGGHPMAGREFSGYNASKPDLFTNASMILTPESNATKKVLDDLKSFFLSLGFSRVVLTDPKTHDKIIAFTSQLAHIASGAYVQSDTTLYHDGFSAGSFRDLTRVAYLNEAMWSELFILNSDNLIFELDGLIHRLQNYRDALLNKDVAALEEILLKGKQMKIASLSSTVPEDKDFNNNIGLSQTPQKEIQR